MSAYRLLLTLICLHIILFSSEYSDEIYAQINDITNPSKKEYNIVQDYISNGHIEFQDKMINWKGNPIPRDLQIAPLKRQKITYKVKRVKRKKKEPLSNCIIMYASFNGDYSKLLKKTYKKIIKSDYVGDVIYRIGGWPNIENGDLIYSHIPNAFIACSIKEAQTLGYKKVLWLNAGIIPKISLNTIFDRIGDNGIFAYKHYGSLRFYCNRNEHIYAFNISKIKANKIYTVAPMIFGLDFENQTSIGLFSEWYTSITTNELFSFTPHRSHCNLSYVVEKYYPESIFNYKADHVNTGDANEEFKYNP